MPDLEDRLRDLLHERADAVHPALTGAAVRAAAERRHTRLVLPLAAAAIVAVLAVSLTFVLNRGHPHRVQPGGATTAPSVSSAPISPSPSPSSTSTSPTPTAPRRPATSPTLAPSAVLGPIGTLPRTSNAPGSAIGTPASSTAPR